MLAVYDAVGYEWYSCRHNVVYACLSFLVGHAMYRLDTFAPSLPVSILRLRPLLELKDYKGR